MNCPVCGTPLDDDATECYVCGYRFDEENKNNFQKENADHVICPTCGYIFDEPASVCPICGTAIDISEFSTIEPEEETYTQEQINELEESSKYQGKDINEEKTDKADHSKRNRNIVIIVIAVALILCGVAAFFLLRDNEEDAEDEKEEVTVIEDTDAEDETAESVEAESANIMPDSDFIGYWNIQGDQDTELAITNITESMVEFSLYWYRNYEINDVMATIDDDNIAVFSDNTDGFIIAGNLTFYEDMVSVQITESNIDTIQPETMIFDEKHSPAWYYDIASDYDGTDDFYGDYGEYYYGDGNDDGFILPESDTELLTYDDIAYLSNEELRLARNEIYARHGRRFEDAYLQDYFDSCWWYEGTIDPEDFSEDMLNDVERKNIDFLKSYE